MCCDCSFLCLPSQLSLHVLSKTEVRCGEIRPVLLQRFHGPKQFFIQARGCVKQFRQCLGGVQGEDQRIDIVSGWWCYRGYSMQGSPAVVAPSPSLSATLSRSLSFSLSVRWLFTWESRRLNRQNVIRYTFLFPAVCGSCSHSLNTKPPPPSRFKKQHSSNQGSGFICVLLTSFRRYRAKG